MRDAPGALSHTPSSSVNTNSTGVSACRACVPTSAAGAVARGGEARGWGCSGERAAALHGLDKGEPRGEWAHPPARPWARGVRGRSRTWTVTERHPGVGHASKGVLLHSPVWVEAAGAGLRELSGWWKGKRRVRRRRAAPVASAQCSVHCCQSVRYSTVTAPAVPWLHLDGCGTRRRRRGGAVASPARGGRQQSVQSIGVCHAGQRQL